MAIRAYTPFPQDQAGPLVDDPGFRDWVLAQSQFYQQDNTEDSRYHEPTFQELVGIVGFRDEATGEALAPISLPGWSSYSSVQNSPIKIRAPFDPNTIFITPTAWRQAISEAEQRGGSMWTNGPLQLFSALAGGILGAGAGAAGEGIASTAGISGIGEYVPSYIAEGALPAGIPGLSEITPTIYGTAGVAGGSLGALGAEADWWDVAKQAAETFSNIHGSDAAAPAAGIAAAAGATLAGDAAPIAEPPLPAAPKPGAPDYKGLWESYSGWLDNVNRINEGAFADVRARLSAAGAAPDLIKMQTEHLESQRVQAIDDLNTSSTFGLLQEGYDIAVGGAENKYEGGLGKYAGPGKPELMDFYTELYGQPSRSGVRGSIGSGGVQPQASQAGQPNPWLDDSGKVSLI